MYNVRILIAEDEPSLQEMLVKYLKRAGYTPIVASDGREAIELAENENYDLVILDIMMPYYDGFEVLKTIRSYYKDVPVIMLTARTSVDDKIEGFSNGADQYLAKPFSIKELMVRISSMLKKNNIRSEDIIDYGVLKIDVNARLIKVEDEIIDFTPREYDLLLYLIDNKGQAHLYSMIE